MPEKPNNKRPNKNYASLKTIGGKIDIGTPKEKKVRKLTAAGYGGPLRRQIGGGGIRNGREKYKNALTEAGIEKKTPIAKHVLERKKRNKARMNAKNNGKVE